MVVLGQLLLDRPWPRSAWPAWPPCSRMSLHAPGPGRPRVSRQQPVALGGEVGLALRHLLGRRAPGRRARALSIIARISSLALAISAWRVRRACWPASCLARSASALVVGDGLLALVQPLEDRLPGERAQDEEQDQEDDDRPERQVDGPLEQADFVRSLVLGVAVVLARPCRFACRGGTRSAAERRQRRAGRQSHEQPRPQTTVTAYVVSIARLPLTSVEPRPSRGEPAPATHGRGSPDSLRHGDQNFALPATRMQTISAKNVAPSRRAAMMIMAVWMLAGDLRLAGHALQGGGADLAEAQPAPMMRERRAEAGAEAGAGERSTASSPAAGLRPGRGAGAWPAAATERAPRPAVATSSWILPRRSGRRSVEIGRRARAAGQCSGYRLMPMNRAVRNVNTYACRKATNSSSRLRATTPSTLATVTPPTAPYWLRFQLAHDVDEHQDHAQHHVPGEHVGEQTHGQHEALDDRAQQLDEEDARTEADARRSWRRGPAPGRCAARSRRGT